MRKIGKYTLTRKLGSGGMGVVYAAHDPTANRAVALKILATDEADRSDLRRFEREAWAAAQVRHPNTVAVLDAGDDGGKPFLVMELVDGQNAGQLVERRGPVPWETAAKIVVSACKGLAAVHAAGLVHRDVKPANVMISRDGVVKLADFGLAKMANRTTRSLTGAGTIGTPHFMSPEQCHNEPTDGRTDIYSLGATFYVLLTGRTPYSGDNEMQVMYAHCNNPVPDPRVVNPDLPPGCSPVVRKAMAKSPSDRYPTAEAMQVALEGLLARNGAEGDPTEEKTALFLPPETVPSGPVVPRGWLRDHRVTRRRILLGIPAGLLIGATAAITLPYFRKKVADITKEPVPPAILVPVREVGAAAEAVAVTDDGRWLAVGMSDDDGKAGGVKLFDRSKGDAPAVWWKWPHETVYSVAFSPDGKLLAVGGKSSGKLLVWDTAANAEVPFARPEVKGNVRGVAFSPDGRFLAAAVDVWGDDQKGLVRVWDARKQSHLHDLVNLPEAGRSVSFSHDGDTLAAGMGFKAPGNSPAIDLWDAASGTNLNLQRPIITFQTVIGPVAAFARGVPLLAVTERNWVRFYQPMSFRETGNACFTQNEAAGVALSPDGSLAAITLDNDVILWETSAPRDQKLLRAKWPAPKPFTSAITFTADGKTVIAGCSDKRVYEWNVPPA